MLGTAVAIQTKVVAHVPYLQPEFVAMEMKRLVQLQTTPPVPGTRVTGNARQGHSCVEQHGFEQRPCRVPAVPRHLLPCRPPAFDEVLPHQGGCCGHMGGREAISASGRD